MSGPLTGRPPRRVAWARTLTLFGAFALLAFFVRLRCQQMEAESQRGLDAGLSALADALRGADRWDDAERGFRVAARESLGDPWPLFCLEAVHELRGGSDSSAGLMALRGGRLAEARTYFTAAAGGTGESAERAAFYVRFIDELSRLRR